MPSSSTTPTVSLSAGQTEHRVRGRALAVVGTEGTRLYRGRRRGLGCRPAAECNRGNGLGGDASVVKDHENSPGVITGSPHPLGGR